MPTVTTSAYYSPMAHLSDKYRSQCSNTVDFWGTCVPARKRSSRTKTQTRQIRFAPPTVRYPYFILWGWKCALQSFCIKNLYFINLACMIIMRVSQRLFSIIKLAHHPVSIPFLSLFTRTRPKILERLKNIVHAWITSLRQMMRKRFVCVIHY